ncbi:MAG: D-alanyl-D-alanine carboxypeptidase [Proteobacteria bacterium]|nr:D-alanyl-D-alanine carboxypeptidase [Pseudomonadota bacterium]
MKNQKIFIFILLLSFSIFSLSSIAPALAAKKKAVKQPAAASIKQQNDAQEESVEEPSEAKKAPTQNAISKNPYLGAILIDAASGKVLFEDNADARGNPASIIKLMNLLIILEHIKNRSITLQDKIIVTAEAAKIGGSQVYLKENEEFTVDELLYALMVQSGNDAAVALAIHLGGTKDAFVELMNAKAQQLGMANTKFHSVHGLPPGKDQLPDVSTPRDMAKLCQELLKWDDVLRYTSVKERPFRADSAQPFIMRNHNKLLGSFEGCDGFKTGYYRVAGFSIAATASKKGVRAIAVVFGSQNRHVRDAKAKELLARGLGELVKNAPPSTARTPAPAAASQPDVTGKQAVDDTAAGKDVVQISTRTLKIIGIAAAALIVLFAALFLFKGKKKENPFND